MHPWAAARPAVSRVAMATWQQGSCGIGGVLGVVSRRDVMRSLAKLAALEAQPQKASDDEIARSVLSRIDNAPFVAAVQVQLTITAGVVEVSGTVSSENQRQAVLAMLEDTPGVVRVIDRLTVDAALVGPNS